MGAKLDNPYIIQDTPMQIGVSGGRTSGYMLKHLLDANDGKLPDSAVPTFQNTGEECEETLNFLYEIGRRWCPIVWLEYDDKFDVEDYRTNDGSLSVRRQRGKEGAFKVVSFDTASRHGEPFDKMLLYYAQYRKAVKLLDTAILPTLVTRMCTSHLKIKTSERYMVSRGYTKFFRCHGVRYDEPKRYKDIPDNWFLPLVDAKVSKQMVNDWWKTQDFNLDLDEQSIEGNCRYCFLKHPDKLLAIMRKRLKISDGIPDEELLRWSTREMTAGMNFRKDRPSYSGLVEIAQQSLIEGITNKYDFSLVPEYSCLCEGDHSGGEE